MTLRFRPLALLAFSLALAPAAGCRGDGGDAPSSSAPGDTVDARLAVSIGVEEGAAEYLFGDVTGLAVDSLGRVYVSDNQGGTVRVYGADGRHLATIGREGDGPGEFRRPVGPAVGPGGDLFVRDEAGISRLVPRTAGGVPDSFVVRWPGPVYGFHHGPTRLDARGRVYWPRSRYHRTEPTRHSFLVFDGGMAADSVMVPAMPGSTGGVVYVRLGPGGGPMVMGLDHAPFAPIPSWDVTPRGTLLVSASATYAVAELTPAGDTVRVVGRPGERPASIGADERSDSGRALQARLDSLPAPVDRIVGLSEEVRARRIPEVYPAVVAVHAAADGWTWVERWPPPGRSGVSVFDAWDEAGRFRGTVRVPARFSADPRPVFTRGGVHGVVKDPETDVARVVGYRFALPHPAS